MSAWSRMADMPRFIRQGFAVTNFGGVDGAFK
jgi:hypothetical protein